MRSSRFVLLLLPLAVTMAWGHATGVNTNFPAPYNSEPEASGQPVPALEAAARFKLPDGFSVSVFASEPEVQNPIGLAWDRRGRLWIAENYTYAERSRKFELALRDRVVIFDDTDGDGRADVRKVFTDDVQMLTSVEIGLGGVWLMCPPQLLFIPDRNGDDIPDTAPGVVLDGFKPPTENYHNLANGLHWGPDGWLYGRCGASSPGEIGVPGAPASARVPMRGGVWRYHPARKVFEALSSGTTNPWGHDWDEHGELFYINTVNGHLWHVIPGMHFVRPHTIDPNPHAYALIDQHADHWHFDTGQGWSDSRDGRADRFGGGHAHIGMMIYQGDNWPASYLGKLLTLNMHGQRVNVERLERSGSGYVGRHEPDMLQSGDPWFRGMELSTGPDGGVYLLDWSDTGECHESTGVHRTSGRIYKVTYGHPKPHRPQDTAGRLAEDRLLADLADPNAWFARQARLLGQAMLYRAQDTQVLGGKLRQLYDEAPNTSLKLRYLWALQGVGQASPTFLREQLRATDEHVRAWAIRLLSDAWPLDTVLSTRPIPASARNVEEKPARDLMDAFAGMAQRDSSALVRLVLASTLQRLPVVDRPRLAAALLGHAEDAEDHNLPLLIWYGLIAVGDQNAVALADLGAACRLPTTLRCITRRLAEDNERDPAPLNQLLTAAAGQPASFQAAVLAGLGEGFTGWSKVTRPAAWAALSARIETGNDAALRAKARDLSVLFGDGRALAEVKALALDGKADLAARRPALQALIDSRSPDARAVCEQLLNVRFLNATAVRGLAAYDDPALGEKLARNYRNFHPSERPALLETLAARPAFATGLLKEMAAGKIPREELSAFHARQIRSFNNAELSQLLKSAWGEIRDSAPDKRATIERLKGRLKPEVLARADRSHGRAVFNLACASCHRLHGYGGDAGPDLTGAGRDNLDYLLENLVDPSGVVSADYKVTVVSLKDGRVLNGVVAAQNARTLTLKIMNGSVTLEKSEIEETNPSELSLMPEGLLDPLKDDEVRDLIGYLLQPGQAPLPSR